MGHYSSVLKSCMLLSDCILVGLLYELSFFPTAKSLGTAALQPQEGLLERAGGREGEAMSKVLNVFLSSRGAASSSPKLRGRVRTRPHLLHILGSLGQSRFGGTPPLSLFVVTFHLLLIAFPH